VELAEVPRWHVPCSVNDMNPVPPGVFPTGSSLPVDGYLHLLLTIGLAALIIVLGIVLWSLVCWKREHACLLCPVRLRWVRAVFRLDDEGRRIDVLRCAVFGRRPITCGKPCLRTATPM
jgi:hypothetical protein